MTEITEKDEPITEEEALTRASNLKSVVMAEDDEVKALREDGLTIDQIHEKYPHLSRAKIGRLVQGLSKKIPNIETKREIKRETNVRFDEDISEIPEPISQEISQDTSQHPSLPSGTLLFEQGDLEAIRNLIPKPHQATYIAHLDVVAKRQRLGHNNNGHNNDGYGMTSSGDEELKRAEAETEREYAKMLRDERMRARTGHGQKNDSELERRLDRIENKLDKQPRDDVLSTSVQLAKVINDIAQPKGHGVDPGAYIQQGISLVKEVERNVNTPSPKNQYDLEVEKLRSERDIDNRKIDFEEKKWEHQEEKGDKTLETVKEIVKTVTSGPVGRVLENLGGVAVRKLEGAPKIPTTIDIPCPSCTKTFKAIQGSKELVCPFCGAMLQLQQQPQVPQPSQEQEPQATTEQAQTQQEKPEEPEKPSEKPSTEVIE